MESLSGAAFYLSSGYKSELFNDLSEAPQKIYGNHWAPEGWGSNFYVEIMWSAEEKAEPPWRELLKDWDHKYFNDFSCFAQKTITLERITIKIFEDLKAKTHLQKLFIKVSQGEGQFSQTNSQIYPAVSWASSYKFNSLHRHHNENLTLEENEKLFRKCSQIHGHEYCLTVEGTGPIDETTGVVFWHSYLDESVNKKVIKPFHGHFINDTIGNTSGETLLQHIEHQLKPILSSEVKWDFFLKETKRNSFAILT